MHVAVSLSKLSAGRMNPRRVKPEREAHRKLVASIRAYGLLQPLVVQPTGDDGCYRVIAGKRRLAALRDIHRGEDAQVQCVTQEVDDDTAASMSLAENFAREAMHPLDEAEAFARLARTECKGVAAIADEFGVSQQYVRQRMKLAALAEPIRAAFREGTITVGIAEAFAAVPEDRQVELWDEVGGNPRHAQHVRNLIEHRWIPATHALFDVDAIDPAAVSHDLFGGDVLIERRVFLAAQAEALVSEQAALVEEGWKEVVIAPRDEVQDRLYATDKAGAEFDAATEAKLAEVRSRREAIEETAIEDDDTEQDVGQRLDALDEEEEAIITAGTATYPEAVKAAGTVFLVVSPDGQVERAYRTPRHSPGRARGTGGTGHGSGRGVGVGLGEENALPTSDDLSDRQRAEAYAVEAIAVREAVSRDPLVQKRLLVLALHHSIRKDGLAVRSDVNGTTLHAQEAKEFSSPLFAAQQARRQEIDPFIDQRWVTDDEAYRVLVGIPEETLDALIATLVVELVSGHAQRETPLVRLLGDELGVRVRDHWTPEARWLAGYQKAQLAHLVGTLKGPAHGSAALKRKKSELVEELAALFAQAAAAPGGFEDAALAERVNGWTPSLLTTSYSPTSPIDEGADEEAEDGPDDELDHEATEAA